ncbi:hypothetical protein [Methylobacterium sp. WL19]|uniref:hypothetical protein n=1 Tax=Methylobacterium sp. WL19 TaxID=2603896 RepID=UPI0011CBFFCF|nr:hypothetical protein [Methylobacterium sp. WL19]TXN33884.1 hypothetical protein FV220_00075 [Methylobacterium sp. WL19]
MTRVRVWYDDACDQIFISGEMHSYAPRSLVCALNGNGTTILIHIAGTADTAVAGGNYADFGGADGIPFSTPQATKAYLDGVFSRTPLAGQTSLTFGAGQPIGGHKAVRVVNGGQFMVASSDDASQIGTVIGVSSNAADQGDDLRVVSLGEITELSWGFVPGPVFLGVGGSLVQTPPSIGFIQQMGVALSTTKLLVALSAPIALAE